MDINALNDCRDQIPELVKHVYCLKLLSQVSFFELSGDDKNSWLGMFFDTVDLLEQSCSDMKALDSRVGELICNLIG